MNVIQKLTDKITSFRDNRDWKQFHRPKDLAAALSLEASEVLAHFLWLTEEEQAKHLNEKREEVADELADVMYWVLLMSNDFSIDIEKALIKKLQKNEDKYPIEKAKGKHTKYTNL